MFYRDRQGVGMPTHTHEEKSITHPYLPILTLSPLLYLYWHNVVVSDGPSSVSGS